MISPAHADFLRAFLKNHSGYMLEQGKDYILESKLHTVIKAGGHADVDELIAVLRQDARGSSAQMLLQAMTINETMFFRDNTPFDQLQRNILPDLVRTKGKREVSIWCTACSSGQEPYSIAMLLHELKDSYPGCRFSLYASDLSEEMIEKGRAAQYTDFEVARGLSDERRERYMERSPRGGWLVRQPIRDMVTFDAMNLLQIRPDIGPFDVVFCRNVLIYFDTARKISVLNDIRKTMRNGSYLLAGASEVLDGLSPYLRAYPDSAWRGVYEAI